MFLFLIGCFRLSCFLSSLGLLSFRLWLCGLLNFINFWKFLVIIFLNISLPCFIFFLRDFQLHICYTIWYLFISYITVHFSIFSLYVSLWITSIYLSSNSLIISSALSSLLIFWKNSLSLILVFLYLFFLISIYFFFHIWVRMRGIVYLTES